MDANKIVKLAKSNNGFSMVIFITGMAIGLVSLLLIYYLTTMYLGEMEAFYDDLTIDCFAANKAAILEMKNEYEKQGLEGEYDTELCKKRFRERLAATLNVMSVDDDFLPAEDDNLLIKQIEIKEYEIKDNNTLSSLVYITGRPLFFPSFLKEPVYKIRTTVPIENIKF